LWHKHYFLALKRKRKTVILYPRSSVALQGGGRPSTKILKLQDETTHPQLYKFSFYYFTKYPKFVKLLIHKNHQLLFKNYEKKVKLSNPGDITLTSKDV
jgi:hypothetical protein